MKQIYLIAFFLLALSAYAQDNFLKKNISLELNDVRLEDALLEISDKGGFNFSYNADMVRSDSLVSISLENAPVKDALDELFSHEAAYHATGRHLVIQMKKRLAPPAPKAEYHIAGYVYNHLSGEKVPYVSVYEVNSLSSAMTNEAGYFNLTVSADRNYLGLAVSKEDFRDTVLIIQPQEQSLEIYIKPRFEKTYDPILNEPETISMPPVEELKIVQRLVPVEQRRQARNVRLFRNVPVQVSLIPSVGTNNDLSGSMENHFSLNILGGYSKGLKGLEVGGLFNVLRNDMKGVQAAGLGNFVGGSVQGLQLAGLYNHAIDTARGLQISGIVNINHATLEGVQVAGIHNHVTHGVDGWQVAGIGNSAMESVDGFQLGGIFNFAKKDVNWFQIGGIVNHSRNNNGFQIGGIVNSSNDVKGFQIGGISNQAKTVNGFQIGGITNIARDSVGGFQIGGIANYAPKLGGYQVAGIVNLGFTAPKGQVAGILNVAAEEVRGFQVAGILNLAKKVSGSQIGLVNVSESITGVPVGFLSFVREGYHEGELTFSELQTAQIAFRTGVKSFYNIFSGGIKFDDSALKTAGYGVGTMLNSEGKTAYALELSQHVVFEKQNLDNGLSHLSQLAFRFRFLNKKRLAITAGPTLNLLVSDWRDDDSGAFLSQAAPYTLFSEYNGTHKTEAWAGFTVGFAY